VSRTADLIGVAWTGLTARKVRTFLIMLGPIVGVAAMVGAVGLTESAKGDLKEKLSQLGTNLFIAQAGGTFGSQNPTFPADAVTAGTLSSDRCVGHDEPDRGGRGPDGGRERLPGVPVPAAPPTTTCRTCSKYRWRRPLAQCRRHQAARAPRCSAPGIAKQYGYLRGENRTIRLNTVNYGVVGVMGSVALDPDLDNAVFVTQWAAKHDFSTDGKPNQLYVRSNPNDTQATADAIPTAINLGGPMRCPRRCRARCVEGRARPTKRCSRPRCSRIARAAVGGLGIANVMSISVIQRSSEIGIRRAVGHSRSKIGSQFLLESLSSACWAASSAPRFGIGIVYLVSASRLGRRDRYAKIPIWMAPARCSCRSARPLPVDQAARLEPLETLRLG
jgi:putative ABC transport system permease protein